MLEICSTIELHLSLGSFKTMICILFNFSKEVHLRKKRKKGSSVVDILMSRSLIQQWSIGDEEANFEIHNLAHDLATMHSFKFSIKLDEHHMHKIHNFSYN